LIYLSVNRHGVSGMDAIGQGREADASSLIDSYISQGVVR